MTRMAELNDFKQKKMKEILKQERGLRGSRVGGTRLTTIKQETTDEELRNLNIEVHEISPDNRVNKESN